MEWTSLVAQMVKHLCLQCERPGFDPWVGKIPWRRKWQPTPVLLPRKSHGRRSLVSMGSQRVGHDWATSLSWTSLVAQMVKHLSTMWETRVRSLGQEDPLEKEMAIHSSTIAWKIPSTEEPGRLHVVHGVTKSRTRLSDFTLPYLLHCRQILYHLSHQGSPLFYTLLYTKLFNLPSMTVRGN